ncbi:saccharopine dehydrogenase-like oxidoreductase [Trichonephila inaurata madagascariensis]|uniref:Saccharopine dehydrogenase-like oxidoreductase n=1 Tax=Trichonephila inaurata madagascariensis TaxID=2747483 RepID=A0A8X6WXI2_9ARAC|nr:saccharopine dehydrogenase-like oxidoreductase [Trichonephila inaurata madagascariensis]
MTESERKYDLVVFGASGVTGKYVIEELAVFHNEIRWCVAGRNPEKLRNALREASDYIGKDLSNIAIIEADVSNEESLTTMCRSATVLLNCVGPYRFSGEKIVEYCVKNKTHCVDVSGEPQFLETVQLKYFHEAKEQGVYIVGSCGFDSIPCDLGVEILRKKFDGDMNSVETFLSAKQPPGSTVNFGTWQSAIYGLAHADELKPLRKALKEKVFSKSFPKPEYKLKARSMLFNSKETEGWCIPFIGSDRSVILRTQMYNFQFKNERPVQIQTYMKPHSFFTALATLVMGAIFMMMTKFALGRDLLEKFPEIFSLGVFSRTPPKKEQASSGSFEVRFKAVGWSEKLSDPTDKHTEPPNKTVTGVLTGPDPAYISTAVCIVNSALVILSEKDKLPLSGGVFTPAAAFSNTSLPEKLESRGIKFRISSSYITKPVSS